MADSKITGLTELAATPSSGDMLVIVDVSDTTMAATGTDKKLDASRIAYNNAPAVFTTATATSVSTSAVQPLTTVSMANNAINALSTWTSVTNGMLLVIDLTEGSMALFNLRGGNNSVTELNDAFSVYSATSSTASSTNVYYSSGYKIENKRGSTRSIAVIGLGA